MKEESLRFWKNNSALKLYKNVVLKGLELKVNSEITF